MTSPVDVQLNLTEAEKTALAAEITPEIQKLVKIADDPDWKSDKRKDTYEVFWIKPEGSSLVTIKSEGIIDAPVKDVAEFLQDYEKVKNEIDTLCMEGKEIATFGDKFSIVYSAYKMPPLITSRDILMVAKHASLDNGMGVTLVRSVERPEVPERHGYVRAFLHTSGYIYKPLPNDASKTFLQYISNIDPKGSIPHWAVNATATDEGKKVQRIQEHFAKK